MGMLFKSSANRHLEDANRGMQDVVDGTQDTMTRWWNNIFGATQRPLADLLDQFRVPRGIFPRNHSKYNFEPKEEGEGMLVVTLPGVCEVKFSDGQVLRYQNEVSCYISEGLLSDIQGLKAQGHLRWIDVTAIVVRDSRVEFIGGAAKKTKEIAFYRTPREAVELLTCK